MALREHPQNWSIRPLNFTIYKAVQTSPGTPQVLQSNFRFRKSTMSKNAMLCRGSAYLLSHRLILGIMVEPPCTTFSIIRRPALRSRDAPYGYNPAEEKTHVGNVLGCRACQLMRIAGVNRVAGLLETTYSSMLKHLLAWHSVQNMACSKTVRVDSCRFGPPHLKSFRMLCVHLSPNHIDRRCVCTRKHLQVQGKYTKGSATYTDLLADAIALDFAAWIFAERKALIERTLKSPPKALRVWLSTT